MIITKTNKIVEFIKIKSRAKTSKSFLMIISFEAILVKQIK